MKLLILQDDFPPYHLGGAAVVASDLAKEFVRMGHVVRVVTTVREKSAVGKSTVDGIEVIRIHSDYHERWRQYRSLYNRSVVSKVRESMEEFSPDAVHAHNVHYHLSYYALVLARRYARKVVFTAHDAMSFNIGKLDAETTHRSFTQMLSEQRFRYNPLHLSIVRRILVRNVDTIVAVSASLKRALEANGFHGIEVIRNSIDVRMWERPDGIEQFKEKHDIGTDAILFGGRLSGAKGAWQMLEALPAITKRVPEAQLLVIGRKDAYADRMLAHASELGVADRIIFTGWINGEALRQAYWAASVVAVPSLYLDPFPTVNLEAFACKKPIVATCFGGSPEIVEDGVNGYIVDPHDVHALAEKLVQLIADREKNAQFGQRGYERVTREFTPVGQAQAYALLFKSA